MNLQSLTDFVITEKYVVTQVTLPTEKNYQRFFDLMQQSAR